MSAAEINLPSCAPEDCTSSESDYESEADIFCVQVSESVNQPLCVAEPCSDSDSSETDEETESDCEDIIPRKLQYTNFCGSQQIQEDIFDLEERDICETVVTQTPHPLKTRKQYTSDIRRLGNKRVYEKTLDKATQKSHIIRSIERGCKCGQHCLGSYTWRQIQEKRFTTHKLKRHEKKQLILDELTSFYRRNEDKFDYFLLNRKVCATAYGAALFVSKLFLVTIRALVRQNTTTIFPRLQKKESPSSENTPERLDFKAWFDHWKNGRGNYQPDSPEFHLAPGVKLKDIHRAYHDYRSLKQGQLVSRPTVYRWLAVDFPEVKKRKWVRFTKCSTCCKLDDRIEKAGPDRRRKGARNTLAQVVYFVCVP